MGNPPDLQIVFECRRELGKGPVGHHVGRRNPERNRAEMDWRQELVETSKRAQGSPPGPEEQPALRYSVELVFFVTDARLLSAPEHVRGGARLAAAGDRLDRTPRPWDCRNERASAFEPPAHQTRTPAARPAGDRQEPHGALSDVANARPYGDPPHGRRPSHDQAGRRSRLLKAGMRVEIVAAKITQAALTPNPKARYRLGARNRFSTGLLTMLPAAVTDRIKRRIAGVSSKGAAGTRRA
jgi:hypothetical protein